MNEVNLKKLKIVELGKYDIRAPTFGHDSWVKTGKPFCPGVKTTNTFMNPWTNKLWMFEVMEVSRSPIVSYMNLHIVYFSPCHILISFIHMSKNLT